MKRSGLLGKVCVALGMFLVMLSVVAFVDRAEGGCSWVGSHDCTGQLIVLCGQADCNTSTLQGACICDFVPLYLSCGCISD